VLEIPEKATDKSTLKIKLRITYLSPKIKLLHFNSGRSN
jgi:hypothetical protein